jgi:Zn-dependent protease
MDPAYSHYVAQGLVYLVALLLSVCVHEFGHAFVADLLGDPLPRSQGRVSLNPFAHADLVGTLILPLMAFFTSISSPQIGSRILGWGKPVQISLSPRHMTRKLSVRTSHALIAIAGPMMNVLFGLLLSGVFILLARTEQVSLATAVWGVVQMNISLCFFNLLPIPPLDGGAVFARILPRSADPILAILNQYGFMILLLLVMLPFQGTTLLGWILTPARWLSERWLMVLLHWAI